MSFYKRRRGIAEHYEVGEIDLFDLGLHDYLCMKAQALVGTGSSVPPGVWIGSAEFIARLGQHQHDGQFVRQRIRKLEKLGWVKKYKIDDTRYAFIINRFVVRNMNGDDYRVNALATTDWRHPVLELERGLNDGGTPTQRGSNAPQTEDERGSNAFLKEPKKQDSKEGKETKEQKSGSVGTDSESVSDSSGGQEKSSTPESSPVLFTEMESSSDWAVTYLWSLLDNSKEFSNLLPGWNGRMGKMIPLSGLDESEFKQFLTWVMVDNIVEGNPKLSTAEYMPTCNDPCATLEKKFESLLRVWKTKRKFAAKKKAASASGDEISDTGAEDYYTRVREMRERGEM